MNKDIGDEDLRQALITYYDAVIVVLPDPAALHYSYSPAHKLRMERLIRSHERRERRVFTLQRVAVVLLALLLTFGSWLAVDVHAREVFFNWVRTVYEDHVVYRFHGGSTSTTPDTLPEYELGWIPEGFELVDESQGTYIGYKTYENKQTEDVIVISYAMQLEHTQIADYSQFSKVEIDSLEGWFFLAADEGDSNELIWFDEENGIVFHLNSTLPEVEIVKLAGYVVSH